MKIKKHFMNVSNIYFNLLNEYKKIMDLARNTISVLSFKKIANCKVLAQRILLFNVEEIYDEI